MPLTSKPPYNDPLLLPFESCILERFEKMTRAQQAIIDSGSKSLIEFADYHHYFGLHLMPDSGQWVFREWAPNAAQIFIIADDTGWEKDGRFELERIDPAGIFEGVFPGNTFWHEKLYRLKVIWESGEGDRIPTAARRVVQDPHTLIFNAQVWEPDNSRNFRFQEFHPPAGPLLIYEAHPGMALEAERIGTFVEFERHILPKIAASGYNTLQLMAVAEHPYYASFGYHVSSFFAVSSRFGTPDDFRQLVDSAHKLGIRVLIDIIHSHAVSNEVEGLSRFDGTLDQFFKKFDEGFHPLWDSRCFDYEKPMVLKFLLSNIRYWIEEFGVDGFRFDGITSMIYRDHGVGRHFSSYEDYYGDDVDQHALSYMYLANRLTHQIRPDAVTIAEEVSGYPGLAALPRDLGIGFDFRFSMGIADYWIRLLKEYTDEAWPLGTLWHELTSRRNEEKTISYAECHDQALVGDQTIMMRLMGKDIYTAMSRENRDIKTVRAVALHKMIRLITAATAGDGYLNFMGNEFGHPEWIDFPCDRNNWSFFHARRQWSLKYDRSLYYSTLSSFDRQMVEIIREEALLDNSWPDLYHIHEDDRIIAFGRRQLLFVFNFNPHRSFVHYPVSAPAGKYKLVLDTDQDRFGGLQRLEADTIHFTVYDPQVYGDRNVIRLYLPTRTALVLKIQQN